MIMQILDLKQMNVTKFLFYQEIIQEDRQKGRQEGEAALVIRQLTRWLGALSEAQMQQIRALSVEVLENLGA